MQPYISTPNDRIRLPRIVLTNPRLGQVVLVRYNPRAKLIMGHLHDKLGTVIQRSRGKPRNHLVDVDGRLYVIPCGNLFPTGAAL